MIKLTDLEPRWFSIDTGEFAGKPIGVSFLCPKCPKLADHRLFVPFERDAYAPDTTTPIWVKMGDSFDNLTLTPSIYYPAPGSCDVHFFLRHGLVVPA